MRLERFLASLLLAATAAPALAAGSAPPPLPKRGQKLPTAKRRPAPRILTLAPGQKRITGAELKKGLTPEQKEAVEAKRAAAKKAAAGKAAPKTPAPKR